MYHEIQKDRTFNLTGLFAFLGRSFNQGRCFCLKQVSFDLGN